MKELLTRLFRCIFKKRKAKADKREWIVGNCQKEIDRTGQE
jgi:hypothetical protein